jgi:acyl-CoA thioesterase FadM
MTLTTFDDFFNPKFVFFSPIRTAAVDQTQLAEHVDHAIIALDGRAPFGGGCSIELLEPASDAAAARVELWVNDLDDYTCTYGFLVSSEDGRHPFARGERTVVSIDPASHKPQKWSSDFREIHADLRKDLPAYA